MSELEECDCACNPFDGFGATWCLTLPLSAHCFGECGEINPPPARGRDSIEAHCFGAWRFDFIPSASCYVR